jgi:hypothetical protein
MVASPINTRKKHVPSITPVLPLKTAINWLKEEKSKECAAPK